MFDSGFYNFCSQFYQNDVPIIVIHPKKVFGKGHRIFFENELDVLRQLF